MRAIVVARATVAGMSTTNPVLVEAWRGETLESFHRGAFAIVDGDGATVASLGDVERPVFPRSAVKLLQALPLVALGAADRLGLDDSELALACASHTGEPEHTASAAAMLGKAGLDAGVLECGCHWPTYEPAARPTARGASVYFAHDEPSSRGWSPLLGSPLVLGRMRAGRGAR